MHRKDDPRDTTAWLPHVDKAYDRIDRFLTNVEERADIKESTEYLRTWYEAYERLILYIGTVAAGILVFTLTFLLKDYLTGTYAEKLKAIDLINIRRSIVLFAICLFFVATNLLATYNWFVHGLEHAIRKTGTIFKAAGDRFEYRKRMGSMSFWGNISLLSGYAASICLALAIYFYVYVAWHLLTQLLQKPIPGPGWNQVGFP